MKNKEIGNYLIWVAVNIIVLLALGKLEFGYGHFYPFGGFGNVKDYDPSEFLVYTIVPLLLILAIKLRKSPNDKISSDTQVDEVNTPSNTRRDNSLVEVIEVANTNTKLVTDNKNILEEDDKNIKPTWYTRNAWWIICLLFLLFFKMCGVITQS